MKFEIKESDTEEYEWEPAAAAAAEAARPRSLFNAADDARENEGTGAMRLQGTQPAGGELTPYESMLTPNASWRKEEGGGRVMAMTPPWAADERQPLPTWIELLSPFTGFVAALAGGKVLAWGNALAPGITLSQETTSSGSLWLAWAWLMVGLASILWRQVGHRLAPRRRRVVKKWKMRRLARLIIRVLGKPAWQILRLTAPFWLIVGGGTIAILLISILGLIRAFWNTLPSLPATAPPPLAPTAPPPLLAPAAPPPSVGEEALSDFIKSMIGWVRLMFMVCGVFYFAAGVLNLTLDKPFAKYTLWGIVCFGMTALFTFFYICVGSPEFG